jgi:hypothetical protein
MTYVGKILVLLYGTASLFCLITAVAIYTQKMNFVTPKGEDPRKVPSLVDKSIAKTKQLLQANNRAFTRWTQNYEEVGQLEVEQYQRRAFYNSQIELALTGQLDGKEVKNPIQIIQFDPAGLKASPPSRIVLITPTDVKPEEAKPGVPLRPPFVYVNGIKKASDDVASLQKESLKLLADESKITKEINGTDQPFVKGLRRQIKEQEHIGEIADNERVYLEDSVNTRRIDLGVSTRLRDAVKARSNAVEKFFGAPKSVPPPKPGD